MQKLLLILLIGLTLSCANKPSENQISIESKTDGPEGTYSWEIVDLNNIKEGEGVLEIKRDNTWKYTSVKTRVYPRETKVKTGLWEKKTITNLVYKFDRSVEPEKVSVDLIKFKGDESGILQYFINFQTKKMMLYQWDNPYSRFHNFNDDNWSRGKDIFLIGVLNKDDVLRISTEEVKEEKSQEEEKSKEKEIQIFLGLNQVTEEEYTLNLVEDKWYLYNGSHKGLNLSKEIMDSGIIIGDVFYDKSGSVEMGTKLAPSVVRFFLQDSPVFFMPLSDLEDSRY